MQYYETAELSADKAAQFKKWFEAEIGTDCEENEDEGLTYFLCSDLTSSEVKKIRAFENSLTEGSK